MSNDNAVKVLRRILRGFDDGVWVRSCDGDFDSGWIIKMVPYLRDLADAKKIVEDAEMREASK